MFGDDILEFGSSTDFTPPPRDDMHPKIEKQRTTSMIFQYMLGLDVRMSSINQ
jgi:hypothetical protein